MRNIGMSELSSSATLCASTRRPRSFSQDTLHVKYKCWRPSHPSSWPLWAPGSGHKRSGDMHGFHGLIRVRWLFHSDSQHRHRSLQLLLPLICSCCGRLLLPLAPSAAAPAAPPGAVGQPCQQHCQQGANGGQHGNERRADALACCLEGLQQVDLAACWRWCWRCRWWWQQR